MSTQPESQPNGQDNPAVVSQSADKDDHRDEYKTDLTSDYESDAFSEAVEESGDVDSQILSAYHRLSSRHVDLVGDYAGDELFLIEGDSMLRRCFDDDKLDFTIGLQVLHAVYNVENFLHQLAKRKCNFNIVFFNSSRQYCLPPASDSAAASKYFMARAAIIRHLSVNLPKSHPHIKLQQFESLHSPDFKNYLQKVSPYFVMAHDGAEKAGHARHHSEGTASEASKTMRVSLRKMILSFISRGYNVALVNGLEWRDTKVMTMVLEQRRRASALTLPENDMDQALPKLDSTNDLSRIGHPSSGLTESQKILVLTVVKLFHSQISNLTSEQLPSLCAALLLHQAILTHLPMSCRRLSSPAANESAQSFLRHAAVVAESILNGMSWHEVSGGSDTMDLIDGRLFLQVIQTKPVVATQTKATFDILLEAVQNIVGDEKFPDHDGFDAESSITNSTLPATATQSKNDVAVLPFSNKVFDKHLESIKIKTDANAENQRSLASRKVFHEVSHWHNAKRPLAPKGPQPVDTKQAFWAARRNQWFMAEMRTYAASLTNAVGKSLEPETIITGVPRQSATKSGTQSPADSDLSDSGSASAGSRGKPGQKKGGGGKTAAKNAGKQAMLNQIAANKAKKDETASDKIASSWQVVCKGFEADTDVRSRYRKAKEYLTNLQPSWRDAIGSEIELYLVNCLLHYWIEACRNKEKTRRIQVAALIWSHLRSIGQRGPLPKTVAKNVQLTAETLALPPIASSEAATDRKLSFAFALPTKVTGLSIESPSREFQLLQCGPYLERSFDSKPDPRVDFQPDGWQRRVLDTIDADQSVFVVAPTSAGKTFISFYAMRKVLEADDDGVLVYVAPTKALVNQIAAEIQARYSKKFKYGGKSVWAIHTRDYRINNPNGCQVLVTVPHVLQIMLLAPSNANSWSSRVKRIIFDEIHSIGQAEDGVVWEQLLLMAPCPIIALSATVGNPDEFSEWLATTQSAIGKELQTVQHPYRYSDLRKYYYVPPRRFAFGGIPQKAAFGSLGLEGLTGFNYVHPVAGLVDKSRGIPEDLALEPRDCLYLWQAMTKVQSEKFKVPGDLNPEKVLPAISRKVDILKWEAKLKDTLRTWLVDSASPYDKLLHELEQSFRSETREDVYPTVHASGVTPDETIVDAESVTKSTLPMLCRLQEQDALPAILFNYDRNECERICGVLLEQLAEAELKQRKSGPKWERTLERWEEWKTLKEKISSKNPKSAAKKTKKNKDDEDDDEKTSKLDMQRDAAGGEDTKWGSFDPEAPAEGYHFADHTRAQASELEVYVRQLKRRDVPAWLIDALGRGIGVHHAGMNRKYRQVVEILFRKGFLRVVIATGTLALGINMPCKTVVFAGDSVFLTALNYRQCAGRAGRRGFDLLGNVVFQAVARPKVCRLISSRLPDLNGHFPITTTLVLRLFTLLHDSNNSKYAVSAINALLSQPRLYLGGPSFKDQTMHHLRFSIEYLRRQQLLGSDGAPLNFAGLVSHLYFTENSSFAFHALLKEGFFHDICKSIDTNEKDTLETLMLVMSHLFGRRFCLQADLEYQEKVVKPSSSIVFLPPLPEMATRILKEHNEQTLHVYRAYVKTFVEQHIETPDDNLPLTRITVGNENSTQVISNLPQCSIRSSFVALSGAGDEFDSIHDLCHSTRAGVFLEEAVIPYMETYPEESEIPINAYLLDFFKHGDVKTIERANRVRRADIWFLLNDFSLVLATIITSLANFMKLADASDLDMLDIMGRMDAHEEEEDDKMAEVEQQSEVSGPSVADSAVVLTDRTKSAAPTKRQAKNADSWEDLAEDEEDGIDSTTARELGVEAEALAQELSTWEEEGNQGLRDVLKAFQKLHAEFNVKFKAMWA